VIALELTRGKWRGRRLALRELRGRDERAAGRAGGLRGVDLLRRLALAPDASHVEPPRVPELPLAERDRALAQVYREAFDDRIEGRLDCAACAKAFEFGFELSALERDLTPAAPAGVEGPDDRGIYREGDLVFRLPDSHDVDAVRASRAADPGCRLLERCLLAGDLARDGERLATLLPAVAPTLDVDLPARCPECAAQRTVRFEMQRYLMRALAQEARWLTREAHIIACAYGWDLGTILSLTRSERREHARLIELERSAPRRRVA
jgi:hypothetical protein